MDIARMVLFLASDDSSMCTAQDFIVDASWVSNPKRSFMPVEFRTVTRRSP